jgi:hypothetical protein
MISGHFGRTKVNFVAKTSSKISIFEIVLAARALCLFIKRLFKKDGLFLLTFAPLIPEKWQGSKFSLSLNLRSHIFEFNPLIDLK